MADQQFVAIHHVTFLVEQFPTSPKKLLFFKKVSSLYILTIFASKHGSSALFIEICKRIFNYLLKFTKRFFSK